MQRRMGVKRISLVYALSWRSLPIRCDFESLSLHGAEAWRVSNVLVRDLHASETWGSLPQHVALGGRGQRGSEKYQVSRLGDFALLARGCTFRLIP
ncbi:hypothetical protein DE146DRAFT_477808 [Phaeosphaeria sp. MPI-PUGE-AT-0046c]|nr:hypothetical protein DE146DRAFT_477808 [Phaeosphaeria sp. MPI-PUGE-AT-0046c]